MIKSHEALRETIGYLQRAPGRPTIYLAGDSSFDNKNWVINYECETPRQYSEIGRITVPDVCYWVNIESARHCGVNCAVEESTLGERVTNDDDNNKARLLAQDEIIRDTIRPMDILVISVGANDITLRPDAKTMLIWGSLMLTPTALLSYNPGYVYLVNTLREGIRNYISALTSHVQPRFVIVCGIYYPCLTGSSWADNVLSYLGYNYNPEWLQTIIKTLFRDAYGGFNYLPLHDLLDPDEPEHYVGRVEPSSKGGRLIALGIHAYIKQLEQADKTQASRMQFSTVMREALW